MSDSSLDKLREMQAQIERSAASASTRAELMNLRSLWGNLAQVIKSEEDGKLEARLEGVESEEFSRADVVKVYGTDCHICGEPIDLDAPMRVGQPGWETGLHIDHKVPISLGGGHTLDNCRPSHGLCNLSKGGRLQ